MRKRARRQKRICSFSPPRLGEIQRGLKASLDIHRLFFATPSRLMSVKAGLIKESVFCRSINPGDDWHLSHSTQKISVKESQTLPGWGNVPVKPIDKKRLVLDVPVRVFSMIVSVIFIFAGCERNSSFGSADDLQHWGSPGERLGEFTSPRAVAFHAGELFIVDKTGRVIVYRTDGTSLRHWQLPQQDRGTPTSISVDSKGNLWIPDTHNSRILVYTRDGTFVKQFGSFGTGPGEFSFVTGVAHGEKGDFYVCEHGTEDRIQHFDADGAFVRMFGRYGTEAGELRRPMAMVYHPSGRLFVADAANHRIQCFSADGGFLYQWGERGGLPGQFNYPYDIALGDDGYLYVCEFGNHRVQKFAPDGGYLGQWGEGGTGHGQLYAPWGVAVDDRGAVYIADTGNHRIVRIDGSALLSQSARVTGTR